MHILATSNNIYIYLCSVIRKYSKLTLHTYTHTHTQTFRRTDTHTHTHIYIYNCVELIFFYCELYNRSVLEMCLFDLFSLISTTLAIISL